MTAPTDDEIKQWAQQVWGEPILKAPPAEWLVFGAELRVFGRLYASRQPDLCRAAIAELQRKAKAFDWLSEKLSYCETTDGDTHIRKAESTLEEWINEIWESATKKG